MAWMPGATATGLLVRHRLEELDDFLGVLGRVERLQGRFAGALAFAVPALGVAGLDAGGVAQDQGRHLDGRRRGEHRHAMAALGQQRQPAGVVQVAVRDQDGVELLPGGGGRAVERLGFLAALEHAAVHQHAGLFGLNVIGRAGDFAAGGADDGDFHMLIVLLV